MTTPIYEDMTLYAKWVEPTTATIELEVGQIVNYTPTFEILSIPAFGPPYPTVPIPNPIILHRSGALIPLPNTCRYQFNITSTGHTADSVRWQIGNETPATGDYFILDVSDPEDFTLGGHTLRLTVTRDGVLYMRNIPFTVAP